MLSNPFRRSRTPIDDVRKRLTETRRNLAHSARGIRDGADRVADALDQPTATSRVPLIGAGLAAALGVAYVARKRLQAREPAGTGEPLVSREAVVERPVGTAPPVAPEQATVS